MKNLPLNARQLAAGKGMENITLSIAGQDKRAHEKMAAEKRARIAWVPRDVDTCCLKESQK